MSTAREPTDRRREVARRPAPGVLIPARPGPARPAHADFARPPRSAADLASAFTGARSAAASLVDPPALMPPPAPGPPAIPTVVRRPDGRCEVTLPGGPPVVYELATPEQAARFARDRAAQVEAGKAVARLIPPPPDPFVARVLAAARERIGPRLEEMQAAARSGRRGRRRKRVETPAVPATPDGGTPP